MTDENFIQVIGKDVNGKDVPLKISLADEFREVRGFGRPGTAMFAKQMAQNFHERIKAVFALIEMVQENKNENYDSLKKTKEFQGLLDFFKPENLIVSGVFGKETILQLLAQKDCEGIRYVFGTDE